ncbi:unnamed protein product [Mycena citricolor]|uniref:Zn(2)-C6 fungal-type domain-containing protein n=1 Tax=Mycena citricolor TaxID=2018698 RepID=A0AAD2HSA4_9AGAR|nr:unnamed protein product [Mycena citricolor]
MSWNAQPSEAEPSPQVQLSRPFRSRKLRPCDGCRRSKSRCAIPQGGPPCLECQQMGKQCTFDELPPERKKPKPPPAPAVATTSQATVDSLKPAKSVIVKRPRSPDEGGSAALQALSYAAAQEKRLRTGDSEHASLDLSIGRSLDPHVITTLLTDDLLPIGTRQAGPEDTPLSETAHIRQISCDRSKPQYIIFAKNRTGINSSPGKKQLATLKSCLSLLDPPPSEEALADIYLGLSNPAFPLVFIPPDDQQPIDSFLYSRMCLTALNHCRQYRAARASIESLMTSSEDIPRNLPSRLSSISTALLELSARPVNDVEANYLLLARTIAQAQLLGLHINPSAWALPSWEKELRRTLWWSLRIHDAWMSFLNSRPSHIQADNHAIAISDILGLISASNSMYAPDSVRSPQSFVSLCRLSLLCSRLQTEVCTLASSMLAPSERLSRVKIIEEETEMLLVEVRRDETGRVSSSGVASLMTCILGFRCMLRRISIELSIGLGSPFTPDPATLEMYAEAVDFICALDSRAFDSFWLNYVGHIISSLTSSLIRLSLATSSLPSASMPGQRSSNSVQASPRTMPLIMLCRLQRALQAAHRDYMWDLASPALTRAEAVINCLKSSAEYTSVVSALEGTYEPDAVASSDHNSTASHETASPMPVDYGYHIDLGAFGLDWSGADSGLTGMWGPATAGEGHMHNNILPMYTD